MQLGRDASPAGRLALAAPVAGRAQVAPPAGLGLALPAAGAGTAERAERAERAAEVPIEVEAVPVSAQPAGRPSVNLLSGLLPSSLSLQPCAVATPHATPTPPAPWSSPSSGYLGAVATPLGAVATPLGAATAPQAAPLPAAAAAEVRKDWTELEDEEILRRPAPRALPARLTLGGGTPCHALPYRAQLPPRAAVLTMRPYSDTMLYLLCAEASPSWGSSGAPSLGGCPAAPTTRCATVGSGWPRRRETLSKRGRTGGRRARRGPWRRTGRLWRWWRGWGSSGARSSRHAAITPRQSGGESRSQPASQLPRACSQPAGAPSCCLLTTFRLDRAGARGTHPPSDPQPLLPTTAAAAAATAAAAARAVRAHGAGPDAWTGVILCRRL